MVAAGQAVLVPFGERVLQGIVMELSPYPAVEDTREILDTVGPEQFISQHRLELAKWISQYYLAPLFDAVATQGEVTAVPGLPLRHAFLRFGASLAGAPAADVPVLRAAYRQLLGAAGIEGARRDGTEFQSAPYNLLVTTDWMLVVPRRTEHAGPISVNALGYAGSLFARDSAELALIRRRGPLRILAEVGFPPGAAMGV